MDGYGHPAISEDIHAEPITTRVTTPDLSRTMLRSVYNTPSILKNHNVTFHDFRLFRQLDADIFLVLCRWLGYMGRGDPLSILSILYESTS